MTATELLLALRQPRRPIVAMELRGPALRLRSRYAAAGYHPARTRRDLWRRWFGRLWRRGTYQPPRYWRGRCATRYGRLVVSGRVPLRAAGIALRASLREHTE